MKNALKVEQNVFRTVISNDESHSLHSFCFGEGPLLCVSKVIVCLYVLLSLTGHFARSVSPSAVGPISRFAMSGFYFLGCLAVKTAHIISGMNI